MTPVGQKQLTFNVEQPGSFEEAPLAATLKFTGEFSVLRDLNRGDQLRVIVQDADGQVVASRDGILVGVGFQTIVDGYGDPIGVERVHKAKLA